MRYSIFDAFKCNEDLFYTIYDYLRFVKPEKWNFIHSTDDFNFMLPDEVKDLANDAVNWLENDLLPKINIWNKEAGSPSEWSTLYYMALAYMNETSYFASMYKADFEEREFICKNTILWLRNNIEKIG